MTSDPKVTKIFEDAANYFLKCFFTFKMFRRKSTSELEKKTKKNSCIPTAYTLVAPDPIRVQSCVWCLF